MKPFFTYYIVGLGFLLLSCKKEVQVQEEPSYSSSGYVTCSDWFYVKGVITDSLTGFPVDSTYFVNALISCCTNGKMTNMDGEYELSYGRGFWAMGYCGGEPSNQIVEILHQTDSGFYAVKEVLMPQLNTTSGAINIVNFEI